MLTPGLDSNETLLLLGFEALFGHVDNFLKMGSLGHIHVVLTFTAGLVHQTHGVPVEVEQLVLLLGDNGSRDHIASAEGFFVLFVGKDVLGHNHCLSGAVLARLGSVHCGALAGEFLPHHENRAGLDSTSLNKGDVGATGYTDLEFVIVVRHGYLI